MARTSNDRKSAVTKFCLAMEEHRRTDGGRVRTAKEMVDFFFTRTPSGPEDRLFLHMPPEIRGPIVATWGIRGPKSAIRDTDEKVRQVVFDALAAGDIDEPIFEEGVAAPTLIDWVPLGDWWTFWRTGKLTGVAIQKALATARELALFDDRWFLENVDGRGGKLKGTDTLCDTLSKDQVIAWIRNVHKSGDGSPAGLVSALGWETILAKTSQEALLFALDAFAKKVGLVAANATAPGADMTSNTDPPARIEPRAHSVPVESPVDPTRSGSLTAPAIPAELVRPNLAPPESEANLYTQAVGADGMTDEERTESQWPDVVEKVAPAILPAESGTVLSAQTVKPSYGQDDEITSTGHTFGRAPPPLPKKKLP